MSEALRTFGPLPGELHLNEKLAPRVTGSARPLAPGEYLKNPDGSWSSEMSYTLADPALNKGAPTNVPGMWIVDGRPVHVSEDQAAALAAKSGLSWPAFGSLDEANAAAAAREAEWQKLEPKSASRLAPLWSQPARTEPQRRPTQ